MAGNLLLISFRMLRGSSSLLADSRSSMSEILAGSPRMIAEKTHFAENTNASWPYRGVSQGLQKLGSYNSGSVLQAKYPDCRPAFPLLPLRVLLRSMHV